MFSVGHLGEQTWDSPPGQFWRRHAQVWEQCGLGPGLREKGGPGGLCPGAVGLLSWYGLTTAYVPGPELTVCG